MGVFECVAWLGKAVQAVSIRASIKEVNRMVLFIFQPIFVIIQLTLKYHIYQANIINWYC